MESKEAAQQKLKDWLDVQTPQTESALYMAVETGNFVGTLSIEKRDPADKVRRRPQTTRSWSKQSSAPGCGEGECVLDVAPTELH